MGGAHNYFNPGLWDLAWPTWGATPPDNAGLLYPPPVHGKGGSRLSRLCTVYDPATISNEKIGYALKSYGFDRMNGMWDRPVAFSSAYSYAQIQRAR